MTWLIIRSTIPTTSVTDGESTRCIPPPPIGSVHWGVPNTIEKWARRQRNIARRVWGEELTADTFLAPGNPFGPEHNWVGAHIIRWHDADLRIFPDEFNTCNPKGLATFLRAAYDFVPGSVAAEKLLHAVLDGEQKPIYEAALLDGCDHAQAVAVALEQNIFSRVQVPEPLGWYRLREPYASYVA